MAAGVLLALAACSSAAPGVTSSSPEASSPAPSPTDAPATASPTASPGTSASVGQMVEGFPKTLIPLMPGATVISSSSDKASVPATVALVASLKAPAAKVVDFYTGHLEGQGFEPVPGSAVGAVASKDFVRKGSETVNVAVAEAAGVSTFTIGANISVESAK